MPGIEPGASHMQSVRSTTELHPLSCDVSLQSEDPALYVSPLSLDTLAEVKVSRNGPERRSGKKIIAGTAFRLEFLVGWYYDAEATMAVPELY